MEKPSPNINVQRPPTRTATDENRQRSSEGLPRQGNFGGEQPGSQGNNGKNLDGRTKSSGFSLGGGLGKIMAAALVAVAVVAGVTFFGGKADNVDTKTQQQWRASFYAAPPLRLKFVETAQVPTIIASMRMPEQQKQKLQSEIDVGRTRLVWVDLKDNCAEDGDIVRIDSGGFSQTVKILNAGARVAVPEPPSGVMNIVGVHDGGGGITVEMMSQNTPVNLPVMKVGEEIGVPVIPSL